MTPVLFVYRSFALATFIRFLPSLFARYNAWSAMANKAGKSLTIFGKLAMPIEMVMGLPVGLTVVSVFFLIRSAML